MNQTFSKKLKIYQGTADFSFIDTLTISPIQKNRYSDQSTAKSVVRKRNKKENLFNLYINDFFSNFVYYNQLSKIIYLIF